MLRKYQVYELTNLDRDERVIGICTRAGDPRACIRDAWKADWTGSDRVTFRVLDDFAAMSDAAEFAVIYSESNELDPRRVFIGPDLAPARERQPA